ncbi:patatin-like phospholipase family protein [Roseicella aquatilis]|uniref:PNPLA domain-containing protein n=1 Tax=Roseicella aquatilis TaxID=2527868 RepID=A0A4R4DP70_9PROT|nr:patatin-like phospholipase family protein [Roseicella aquatilis]TCZ63619.1 hypothetical protein EXY23_09550 [Roseicella aquatilis]
MSSEPANDREGSDSGGNGLSDLSETQRAYLVFEGGGAKGIVHVGALAALEGEELNLDIRGAAGTSAGAIVAGLVAAGYTAPEICDPRCRHSVLGHLGVERLTSLLGTRFGLSGWRCLGFALNGRLTLMLLVALAIAFNALLLLLLPSVYQLWSFVIISQLVAVGFIGWLLMFVFRQGICTTDCFSVAYDAALRRKVGGASDKPVSFDELYASSGRLLKVVATRVDTGEVLVFGTHETPHVPVAQAVAASICLPGVFGPATVDGYLGGFFYDGGLVSNLPVWTFDEERLLDPGAVTVAFEIAGASEPPGKLGRWAVWPWLKATARAAVFGAGVLNKRGANRLVAVTLPSSVRLLQFDMGWNEVGREFENGRLAAATTVLDQLVFRPRAFDEACRVVGTQAEAAIAAVAAPGTGPSQVRAFLAVPFGDSGRLLRLAFAWPREFRTDEASVLPVRGSLAGASWRDSIVYFDQLPFDPQYALAGAANAKRRSLVWSTVQWRMTIPVFTRRNPDCGRPAMVLCLDGDGSGDDARAALDEVLAKAFALAIQDICNTYDV